MNQRVYLITENKYENEIRQIAFFTKTDNGIYFDFPYLSTGAHNSYHKDGSRWRTSTATGLKPEKMGNSLELDSENVWMLLGIPTIRKSAFHNLPAIKQRHLKYPCYKINFTQFPKDEINFVVELINSSRIQEIESKFPSPKDSLTIHIDLWEPNILTTILGYDYNQLVRFEKNGIVSVREFNLRFSACRKNIDYKWEATGHK